MQHASHQPRTTLWLIIALVAVVGLGSTGLWLAGLGAKPAASATEVPQSAIKAVASVEEAFTAIAEALKPSVVNISTEEVIQPRRQMPQRRTPDDMRQLPDWFRQWFGPEGIPGLPNQGQAPDASPFGSPSGIRRGLGSGVIIDPAGYILTNKHVVRGADRIDVKLADGDERTYPAKVLATDDLTDLAVVKIKADKPLKAARLGDASKAKVGSWAIAIGSPFGWEGSVTVGVVSAKGRQISVPGIEGRYYRDLIQTDAPINPGNSGGPLVNIHGEVIGINQQIASTMPANVGLGFAIPIDESTKRIIEGLKEGKAPERGLLGVKITEVTPAMADVYGVKHGAYVEQVVADSAASKAGIKEEDVITAFGDTPVRKPDDLVAAVTETKPGSKVKVRLVRDGNERTVTVTLGRLETAVAQAPKAQKARLGLTVSELTDQLVDRYDLGDLGSRKGVVVTEVDPTGDAARVGIRPGDVVLKVDRALTDSVSAYNKAVSAVKTGGRVVIRIWREGDVHTLSLENVGE